MFVFVWGHNYSKKDIYKYAELARNGDIVNLGKDLENTKENYYYIKKVLYIATQTGNIEIFKQYLETIPYQDIDTFLVLTSQYGRNNLIEYLLQNGADIDSFDYIDKAREIYTADLMYNNQEKTHRSALMAACEYGHLETVKLLLKKGADINLQNKYGNTALFYAEQERHTDISRLLLKNGSKQLSKKQRKLLYKHAGVSDITRLETENI